MSVDEKNLPGKAMTRIDNLMDAGSFVELAGQFAGGVITGYGFLDGRLTYVYSQDGPVGLCHAEKILALYNKAVTMGAPVIAILDSSGIVLDEGLETLNAYGKIYSAMCENSGIIPQICVVLGNCIGSAAFIPALSDFVIMSENTAVMALESPAVNKDPAAKLLTLSDFGGAKAAANLGLANFTAKTDDDALLMVKALFAHIPSSNMDEPPVGIVLDDVNRIDENIGQNSTPWDVLSSIADNNNFLEVSKNYGNSMITAFVKLNGYSAGIVANNGKITAEGAQKAAGFVNFCDAYSIPVVSLTNVAGYDFPVKEHRSIIKSCARLAAAFSQAGIPLINVITGETSSSPYALMNSKAISADICFVWDCAAVSVLPAEGANIVLSGQNIEANPKHAAQSGFVDKIIPPSVTRKVVISALEMLDSKRILKRPRKHGSIML